MSEREQWLGHRDLCSIQWSEFCDCEPDEPVEFFEVDAGDNDSREAS